jgi:murein DD-endopeptidase MepM/ murein hydrolase activator NlpD
MGRMLWRLNLVAAGLIISVLLVGCARDVSRPAEQALFTPTPSPGMPASPTAPILASPSFTPTVNLPTAIMTASLTPLPLPEFEVCSPLQDHPLEELRLIVSDPYRPPLGKSDDRHHGVDFSYYRYGERTTIQGVGVQAVLPGSVAATLADTYPFGNLVIVETVYELLPEDLRFELGIQLGESLYLLYAHMEAEPRVHLGDAVQTCQGLGAVGRSGNAVEPHLHLEARLGPPGALFTEMGEYFPEASAEQRAAYQLWRTSGNYRRLDPLILVNYQLSVQ